jgi:hypothetical protein
MSIAIFSGEGKGQVTAEFISLRVIKIVINQREKQKAQRALISPDAPKSINHHVDTLSFSFSICKGAKRMSEENYLRKFLMAMF